MHKTLLGIKTSPHYFIPMARSGRVEQDLLPRPNTKQKLISWVLGRVLQISLVYSINPVAAQGSQKC